MGALDSILKNIQSLPALPATAMRLVSMLTGDEVDFNEVKSIIKMDEAISMAVLRSANSVRYGAVGRVFSLDESIVRLGSKNLMKIAMEHQVSKLLVSAGSSYGLRRGAMWKGSLGGGLAAEELARESNFQEPDLCFLCAMLRDIGKLALDTHFGPDRILQCADSLEPNCCFLVAERNSLGVDHAELGGALAEHWGLPERICDAIRFHHEPPEGELHDDLFDIVHAADVLSLWMGLAIGHDGLSYPLVPHVREGLLGNRTHAEIIMARTWSLLNDYEMEIEESSLQGRSA